MNEIGVIGAGVMGGNLALNFANKGLRVSIYDRAPVALESFVSHLEVAPASAYSDLKVFLAELCTPRKIWLMIARIWQSGYIIRSDCYKKLSKVIFAIARNI